MTWAQWVRVGEIPTYGVVKNKHHGGRPPSPFLVPEEHLADIADIPNLGMAEAEFPKYQRAVRRRSASVRVARPAGKETHV